MNRETRRKKWRWMRHVAWVLAAKVSLILLFIAGVAIFLAAALEIPSFMDSL